MTGHYTIILKLVGSQVQVEAWEKLIICNLATLISSIGRPCFKALHAPPPSPLSDANSCCVVSIDEPTSIHFILPTTKGVEYIGADSVELSKESLKRIIIIIKKNNDS